MAPRGERLARRLLHLPAMNNDEGPINPDSDATLHVEQSSAQPDAADLKDPRAWERTVYNMLYRAVGNRKVAKRLVRQLQSQGPSPERALTLQAKDIAKSELPPEEYARSMFARGRELLSGGPETEDLPRLGPGFDPAAMEKDVKDVLPREHLGLLELVFVDRRPIAEVAELFGVSPELVVTFVSHLVDLLGELSAMVHEAPSPCPHPLRLIRSQIEHSLGFTDREPATNLFCPSCRDATQFTVSLLDLFARDSRILSLGDDRVFRKALEGPRVQVNDGVPRAFPERPDKPAKKKEIDLDVPQALPAPNAAAWKATAMVGCAIVFMASFSMFSIMGGGDASKEGFAKGLKTMKHDALGTYTDQHSPARELIANTTITAGPEQPMFVSYHNGVQIELAPGSSITVLQNRVKLAKGRLRLRTTEGPTAGFFIANGDLVARIKEGDVWAAADEKSPLKFSLKTGVLDVKDARGRRYRLEPANVMKMASSGGFVVEESTAEDVAAVSSSATTSSDADKAPIADEHSVQ